MSIRIPVREEKGRLQALPGARVQAATAGTDALAAVGRGIQDAGRPVVEAVAAEEQRQRTNVLMGKKAELMDLDRGHRESLRKVEGKDAAAQRVKIEEAYDRDSKVIIADTGNQAVRDQVQRFSERHTQSFKNSVSGHVAKETERAAELDYQAVQVGAARDGAEAYAGDDLQAYDMAKENALASTVVRADQQGLGEKPTEEAIAETMARFHSTVLSNLIAEEQDFKAEDYYKKNKDEMSLDDRKRLGAIVEASSRKQRARLEEEEMWSKADGDPNEFASEALKIKDLRKRELVLGFNHTRVAVTEKARRQRDSESVGSLTLKYLQRKTDPRTQVEWELLSKEGQANILGMYLRSEEKRKGGRKAESVAKMERNMIQKWKGITDDIDRLTTDSRNDSRFRGATEYVHDKISELTRRENDVREKGLEKSFTVFKDQTKRMALGDPTIGENQEEIFSDFLMQEWDKWDVETNTGEKGTFARAPTNVEVQSMYANATRLYADAGWLDRAFPEIFDPDVVRGFELEPGDNFPTLDEFQDSVGDPLNGEIDLQAEIADETRSDRKNQTRIEPTGTVAPGAPSFLFWPKDRPVPDGWTDTGITRE